MSRAWTLVLFALALFVGVQIWGPARCKFWGWGVACGHYVVEVRGRLVRPDGSPHVGRGVIGTRWDTETADPLTTSALAIWARAVRAGHPVDGLLDLTADAMPVTEPVSFALTRQDGGFRLQVLIPCSVAYGGGEPLHDDTPTPRSGIHALLVEAEAEGAAPIVTSLPRGTVTTLPSPAHYGEPSFVWDLGEVVVPAAGNISTRR